MFTFIIAQKHVFTSYDTICSCFSFNYCFQLSHYLLNNKFSVKDIFFKIVLDTESSPTIS